MFNWQGRFSYARGTKMKPKSKIKKVILEYEDWIFTVEGKEAVRWGNYNEALKSYAQSQNMESIKNNPIKWRMFKLEGK